MARPTKQGIDYFPIDCQFDDKIEMYLIEKGAVGLGVLVTVWQMIYSNEGYYINNNTDLHLLVKRKIDVDANEVSDCINVGLRRNIFSDVMHQKYGILTSKAIQKRFFDAAKKKKKVQVVVDYVINGVNTGENWEKVCGNATNVKEEGKEMETELIPPLNVKEDKTLTSKPDPVPVKQIVELYHEILPELPQVRIITKARETQIKQRWRESMPNLDNWRNFFNAVRRSDFLMGKSSPGHGRDKPFLADLEWITKAGNFAKIAEKKYV